MKNKGSTETTSFLLKEVPKELWAEVRKYAYNQKPKMPIRDFLLLALEEKIQREQAHEEQ